MNKIKYYNINLSFLYVTFFIFIYSLLSLFFSDLATNFVFVDGVNWYDYIVSIVKGVEGFDSIRSSHVFVYIYVFFVSIFGFGVFFWSLFFLFFFYYKFYYFWGVFLFFPFFYICSLLPSKDIIVLFFTGFLFYFFRKSFFVSLIIIAAIFFVRDGYGLALLVAFFVFRFYGASFLFLFLLFIFGFVFDLIMVDVSKEYGLFMLERTLGFFVSSGDDYQRYLIRVFANITNLSTRTEFFSVSNKFSITAISLFISGVAVLSAFFISIYSVILDKAVGFYSLLSSYFFLVFVFISSYSPLIQPRYLIPIAFFVLFFSNKRHVNYCVFFSFFVLVFIRFLYVYMEMPFPVVDDFDFNLFELLG